MKHNSQSSPLRETLEKLQSAALDIGTLVRIWHARDAASWASSPEVYRLLGEKFLKRGEPLLAFDILTQGLKDCAGDVRLRQLQGLALARSGAAERASVLLAQLVAENHADGETLGMLARTYKDRAARAATLPEARKFLRRAAETYAQAYRLNEDYWTGINAATTALLIGKKARAAVLARNVRNACLRELNHTPGDEYWLLATLGEAALIERDWSQAKDWYARAAKKAGRRFGNLQASRRNARLLLNYWKADPADIERALRVPPVAIFAGHMVDRNDRATRRFPASCERQVTEAIRQRINLLGAASGYASAACGSDILFLEAMLETGGEICVVLPYQEKEFLVDSVARIPAARWRARFERVLEKATRVVVASTQRLEIGGVSYDYANQLIVGLASIRATQLDTEVVSLAVWDKIQGDGPGGTASAVSRWQRLGLSVDIIDLPTLIASARTKGSRKDVRSRKVPKTDVLEGGRAHAGAGSQIRAMLFADTVGFSRLKEHQLPQFVQCFLGAISQLIAKSARDIVAKNTWGDGLHLVFSSVRAAGHFALDLGEMVSTTKWSADGLPAGLNLRIGVHAGPVYECADPIKETRNFFGSHVSRTARIEPITPPGQVYASEAFAALAAAEQVTGLSFDYAGQVPMAKGYGVYPMYHVTRRTFATPNPR